MTTFWVDRQGSFGIGNYMRDRGAAIADRFAVQLYEDIAPRMELRPGAHLFSGLDQLTEAQREAVAEIRDQLARALPGVPLLNDPRRILLRPALLQALAEQGVNDYRVWPAEEPHRVDRFPVFVREAGRHTGPKTRLLSSMRQLRRALAALRLRGYRPGDLLIVEFCDTADAEGVYRKYGAFRVGDAIVPAHVMAGHRWMIKSSGDEPTLALVRESLAYVETNPHEGWIRRVFEIMGAEYGRIDYGMRDGRPQAWEINLNPTIGRDPRKPPKSLQPEIQSLREQGRLAFHARLRDGFAALGMSPDGPTITVELSRELTRRIEAETASVRRRRAALESLRGLYEHPVVGRPLRAIYTRLFPRA